MSHPVVTRFLCLLCISYRYLHFGYLHGEYYRKKTFSDYFEIYTMTKVSPSSSYIWLHT